MKCVKFEVPAHSGELAESYLEMIFSQKRKLNKLANNSVVSQLLKNNNINGSEPS